MYTKGPFQIDTTKKKWRCESGARKNLGTMRVWYMDTNIFKIFCSVFDSITSILRDIKHKTLHLSGAVP